MRGSMVVVMGIVGLLGAGSLMAAGTAEPAKGAAVAKKELVPQKTCPVMGGAIQKDCFVDVKGNRFYMCCPGCAEAIKKDPEKHIKILADRGEAVEKAPASTTAAPATPAKAEVSAKSPAPAAAALVPQKTCPATGEAITSKTAYVDYKGQRIYACCAGCLSSIKADPEKAIKTLADRGESVEVIKK